MLMPRVLQQKFGVLPAHTTGGSSIHATALGAAALATAAAAAALASLTAVHAATTAAASFVATAATKLGWEPPHLQRRG